MSNYKAKIRRRENSAQGKQQRNCLDLDFSLSSQVILSIRRAQLIRKHKESLKEWQRLVDPIIYWRLVHTKFTSGYAFLTKFLKQERNEDTLRIYRDPIIDRESGALTGVFIYLPIGRYVLIPILESLYNEKTKRNYSSG